MRINPSDLTNIQIRKISNFLKIAKTKFLVYFIILFLQIVVQTLNGQTLTYTDLLNMVDNSEYPFESYEFLENKGFIFTESQDYAVALDLETAQGKSRVEGCKMTYYNMDGAYCRINVHSCPPDKNIPMSDFD